MKRLPRFAAWIAAALMMAAGAQAAKPVVNGALVNETALAHDATYTLDMGGTPSVAGSSIDRLSATAAYSSATISAVSPTDGVASTGNFRVVASTAMSVLASSTTLTVQSTTTLAGSSLTINGYPLRDGYEWNRVNTTTGCADALVTAINTYITGVTASSASAVVTITANTAGLAGNNNTATSSVAALHLSSTPNFAGGRNALAFRINGIELVAGVNFTPASTSTGTAKAISDAIVAHPTLSLIVGSTWAPNGVVYATSTATGAGTNYSMESSNTAALVASAPQMSGGAASTVNYSGSYFQATAHGMSTGLPVLYSTGSAYTFTPLVWGTTYYAVRIDANKFGLATSKANAVAGTSIVFTSSSPVGGHTFTLTPLAITGTPTFKWQVSNDNSVFVDLNVSTVSIGSYTNPYASTLWDFGTINFRYIRLNVTGPTTGGILLNVAVLGKND